MNIRRTFSIVLVALAGLGVLPATAGTASAAPSATSSAALRTQADNYMLMSMSNFLAAKARAPRPYNWTDNACSNVPDLMFKNACKRHDFGYRNYGKGLRLDRREVRREWIDAVFYWDMINACNSSTMRYVPGFKNRCYGLASTYWVGVRTKGASAFFG